MRKYKRTTIPQVARLTLATGFGLSYGIISHAQAPDSNDEEEIFELSPFTVEGSEDEGYRATSTLAGTRIRTELKDVGSAISVYTEEFLKDVGATDNGTLLQYTTNAEVGGVQGTYAGVGNGTDPSEQASLLSPNTANRVRGLSAADNTRDYFGTDIPWDSYNTNRIDIQRGANSILFGLGKPAGIINASLADAAFADDASVSLRFGSYGSTRASLSANKVLIEDVLAFRVAGLRDDEKFKQDPAYENDQRIYLAARFEPKLFADDSMKTAFKVKYENGEIDANRQRNVAPYDSVSPFFWSESGPFGGVGKTLLDNPFDAWADSINGADKNPWISGGPLNAQQPFWLIDGESGNVTQARAGIFNTGGRNNDGSIRKISEGLIGRRYAAPLSGINSFSSVAKDLGLPLSSYGQYRSMTMSDPTVFDFYNTLIDGDTKNEWEEWDALNLEFSQTAFNDRLGIQLIHDEQDYQRGGENMLGWRPTVQMDILAHYDDGSANPNAGRPYVTSSGGGGGESYVTNRESNRASLYGELRASDFMNDDSFLAKLLGKHRFNAVYSSDKFDYENRTWQAKANSQAWDGYWAEGANGSGATTAFSDRPPVGIIYLGDSIANRSSSAGANIPGIQAGSIGIDTTDVYLFDTIWNAPSSVGFSDPWTVPASLAAAYGDAPEGGYTQASNPANYLGWTTRTDNVISNYDRGSNPSLLRSAKKAEREVESIAATWQGYWWNDALVTTFGWRKDEVKSHEASADKIVTERSVLDLGSDYSFMPYTDDEQQSEQSISGGAVLHINKLLGSDDPLPFNLSLSYNKGSNFDVGNIRNDLLGNAIPNPSGTTEDYGVLISTKDGKYSFRAIKYESRNTLANSTLQDGYRLGEFIGVGLTWRNVFLYELGGYDWASRDQRSYRNHLGNAYPDLGDGTPEELAAEDAMIAAWNQIQADLTENGFLEAWGLADKVIPLNELTIKSEYQANPAAHAVSDISKVSNYSGAYTAPANFAVTADTVSKGYEFELIANPVENLRIAFNASKTEAQNNNVGGDLINEFIGYLDDKLSSVPYDIPRWGGAGNAVFVSMYAPWRANYVAMKLSEGTNVSELRKWRYNVVANYSFTDGKLKGFGVGGSYRWQDKVGIGYPLVPQGDLFGFDIANPNYGPTEDAIDLWASYGRKLTDKIDWKIQLNIRNAFADDELIPISLQPDNETVAVSRIAPTQNWFITNTFSF